MKTGSSYLLARSGVRQPGHATAAGLVNLALGDVPSGLTLTPGGALLHGLQAAAEDFCFDFVGRIGAESAMFAAKEVIGIEHGLMLKVIGLGGRSAADTLLEGMSNLAEIF